MQEKTEAINGTMMIEQEYIVSSLASATFSFNLLILSETTQSSFFVVVNDQIISALSFQPVLRALPRFVSS
jgi:hypothetical protein